MSKELNIIKEKIAQNKEYLLKTYGVEEIGVFGSFAHGDQTSESDIDIIVNLNHKCVPLGLLKYFDLQNFLEKNLDRKVDLVTEKSIRPAFRKYIMPTIQYI